MLQAVPEPDRLEGVGGQPAVLALAQAAVDQRQADVADRRGPGQQLEVLEDEAHDLVAHRCQLVLGQPGDVAPVEAQRPRGRAVQPPSSSPSRVDLPDPLGPMMATESPCSTTRSTPSSARTSTPSRRYTLVTWSASTTGT